MEPTLNEIVVAFEEALNFWLLHLSDVNTEFKAAVSPAKVDAPLEELVKISKLIKAHTTKVGILFEPSSFKNAGSAAVKTVSELSSSFVLYVSVLAQLSPAAISRLFHREIFSVSTSLITNARLLVSELLVIIKENENETATSDTTGKPEDTPSLNDATDPKATVDPRLVSVGKVWASCDEMVKLIEAGNLRYLEKQTKMHLTLIDDGLDEFSEWAENPEEFDDEDPFGFEDEFSDEEDDESPPVGEEESDSEETNTSSQEKEKLRSYCKLWLEKFKLVRLLFFSINKSLPLLVGGENIDEIYAAQELISRDIDQLIVDIMLSQVIDHVVEKHATNIDKGCYKIVKILKGVNEKSLTKVKWCALWESKFKELLDEMYNSIE